MGDEIETFVVRVNDQEGVVTLSKKRLDVVKGWEDVEAAHFERLAREVKNTSGKNGSPAASAPALSSQAAASSCVGAGRQDWKAQKEEQARLRKLQNELKKTEEEIHRLETRDQEIDELLSQEEVYTNVSRLMELNQEKEKNSARLEELYERWEELSEEVEG